MDRRAHFTRVVVAEIKRLTSDPVGVAINRHVGGNAGWSVTIRLRDAEASALLVGSDEDPYALPDGLFCRVARDLLAEARKRAAKGEAIRKRQSSEDRT